MISDKFIQKIINNFNRNFLTQDFYDKSYNIIYALTISEKLEIKEATSLYYGLLTKYSRNILKQFDSVSINESNNIDLLLKSYDKCTQLLLYPIKNMLPLKNKTYKNYNINVDFIQNISKNIAESINNGTENLFYITDYTIKNNKVYSIICKNLYNIKHIYNSRYKLKKMIFSDGKEMIIPQNKKIDQELEKKKF